MMVEHVYRFGLVGYPLAHSLSPRIHNAALEATSLAGAYRLYPVEPLPTGEPVLEKLMIALRTGELDGLNITIPHKQSVIPFMDRMTEGAQEIGAVNTIYRDGSCLVGENTDASGFATDMIEVMGHRPEKAIVLGAGGAARAVCYALMKFNCEIYLAARRIQQAEQVIEHFRSTGMRAGRMHAISLESGVLRGSLEGVELVVNSTPVGMSPKVDCSPWPEEVPFPPNAVVYDVVYNPRETRLVMDARRAGLQAVSGLGMLLRQAGLAFTCWTGKDAPIEAMRKVVEGEFSR